MRVFITGGSGLLGQYLNVELNKQNILLTQYYKNIGNCSDFNSIQFPITDSKKLDDVFKIFKPDVVIHTAAVSSPERADEQNPDQVYAANVKATADIAERCNMYNAKLVYTSTDLVYAGYRGSMLKEDSKLIPISLYAETKLMGEMKIQETLEDYIILRVSLQVGFGKNHSINNFTKMYNNLKDGKTVKLFTDQYRTPLALKESAKIISELIQKNVKGEIINFGGSKRFSRYELGELTCSIAGFNKNLLSKLTMEEGKLAYKVADVSMDNAKLQSFGIQIKSLRDSIQEAIVEFERK